MDPGNLPITLMRMFPRRGRPRRGGRRRGKVGPSDLLLSQRVARHKGVPVLPIRISCWFVSCVIACVTSVPRSVFPLGKGGEKKEIEALHGLLSKQNVEHVCTQDFTPTHNFPSNVANGSCTRTWHNARQGKVGKTR